MKTRFWLAFKNAWNEYWFAEEPVTALALFRIIFGVSLLVFYLPYFFYFQFGDFYREVGFLWPRSFTAWSVPNLPPVVFWPDISFAPASFWHVNLFSLTFFICIVLVALGYKTKLASLFGFFLNVYLVSVTDAIRVDTISSAISVYFLFLALAPSGDAWSLDAKLRYGKFAPVPMPQAPKTARQLMVVQLALMYFSNALTKVAYVFPAWASGDMIINALYDPAWNYPALIPWVENFENILRLIIAAGFYVFLLLGLGLIFKKTRLLAASFGFLWHFTAFLLTTLPPIWLVWLSFYIPLAQPKSLEKIIAGIKTKAMAPLLVFACLTLVLLIITAIF